MGISHEYHAARGHGQRGGAGGKLRLLGVIAAILILSFAITAILENGQYDKRWAYIHMMPEETAQAAVEIGAKALLPAHSGKSPYRTMPGKTRLSGWPKPVTTSLTNF